MGSSVLTPFAELGAFRPTDAAPPVAAAGLDPGQLDLDKIVAFYRRYGFVILRGVLGEPLTTQIETECAAAQAGVLSGALPARHGSTQYLDDAGKAARFVNYVEHVEELAPSVRAAAAHPVLVDVVRNLIGPGAGPGIWLNDSDKAGIIYQDARPGRESGYSRIGWHSDWQAMPSLDVWPGLAFTIHIDATSPANGFLRMVPGSHQWATPAPYRNINGVAVPADARPAGGYTDTPPPFEMPLGFEKVPGEIAVYADRGDVLLHDAYTWHAAARATDDSAVRRHVRGSYFAGDESSYRPQFVKNAAR
ncbi:MULTISPECIES: phytanoyl-CoA dioxygenase family protein [unclassified Parafrankia]|uniref:phytanoyl-CoA dioxygenase family protein n=1 Tax=Parafrankia TaxID=2994362 RepID=UPI000DA4BC4B|nr:MULTISPECIES: phytanoyl-CoA dioxygenase family protein [unclassified Parafrankia]TCJ34250.1 phytanoyl-CoA dioxygenase [Parafrankia sp. BMG5.11]SQE00782.1 Phytanoyl-CoA dioxygenase [Parafrankia sp. Ea1.12]